MIERMPSQVWCKCGCGMGSLKPHFSSIIADIIRMTPPSMLIITSGYRCPRYNAQIGGAKQSLHTIGHAIDLGIPASLTTGEFVRQIEDLLRQITPDWRQCGIGMSNRRRFIHVDTGFGMKAFRRWSYD